MQETSERPAVRAVRKNMFLAAVLCGADGQSPVKIRNMSRSGAMVEAAFLPEPGTAVLLVRGELQASGHVAWVSDKHIGVAFDGDVSIDAWLTPVRNSEQQRVDAVVAGFKGGSDRIGEATPKPVAVPTVLDSLQALSGLLDRLGAGLSSDPATVERHFRELQSFDIALQMLEAIRAQMAGPADGGAGARRLIDLQAACAQAMAEG